MPRIRPNDPTRDDRHDYLIKDHRGRVKAAFDNPEEAGLYLGTLIGTPGVYVIHVLHPDGCDCSDALPFDSTGRPRPQPGRRD